MHIAEGVLSGPVLATGAALAAGGVAVGLRRMPPERVPAVALLSSAFFVASLIHVPAGPASVHLVLNGLAGLVLGWTVFPAFLVALTLQAVLFQFGGLTTLGVNTFNMAMPAVMVSYLFVPFAHSANRVLLFIAGALCGALALLGSGVLIAACLVFTGDHFLEVAQLIVAAHVPVMAIEGLLSGFTVLFLRKVKPEMLGAARSRQAF